MIVYIIMLLLSLICCYYSSKVKDNNKKILLSVFSALPFIVVAGIRYDVGTDYMFRYVPDYINIANGNTVENLELLFYFLIRICIFITHDYWLLFFISAAITFSLIFKTIYEESNNKLLSIFIFFISSMFFISLNLMRQYISIAIIYSTYKYLINDKYLKWVISVIIASLFHTVSLVFLLAFFLKNKKINIYLYFVLLIVLIIFGKSIVELFLSLFSRINISNLKKYSAYLSINGNFSWSHFLVELSILLYYLLVIKLKNIKMKTIDIFYLNCQYLVLLFSVLNTYNELFLRISFVFSIFQISSIPYFYIKNKNMKTKEYKNVIIFREPIMIGFIIVMLSSRLIYSNIIKNSVDILPYQTIFNRGEIE